MLHRNVTRLLMAGVAGLVLISGPRMAYAGSWQTTITGSGSATNWPAWTPPAAETNNFAYPPYVQGDLVDTEYPGSCSDDVSVNATITLQWVPASGKTMTTGPPPGTISVKEKAYAVGDANGYDDDPMSVSSNDGFGDTPVVSSTDQGGIYNNGGTGSISSGVHLTMFNSSSGTVTFNRTFSGSGTFTASVENPNSPKMGGGAFAQAIYSVTVDTRTLILHSDLDQTYHSSNPGGGQGTPVPNISVANTINADTVLPISSGVADVAYNTVVGGAWNPDSSYSYAITAGSGLGPITTGPDAGTFTIPNDLPLDFDTWATWNGLTMPANDTTTVTATDSADGAVETATYELVFHNPAEGWVKNGSPFQLAPVEWGTSDSTEANATAQVNGPDPSIVFGVPVSFQQVLGGILTTGTAVVAIAQPLTDPVIIGFMAAGGYSFSLVAPPPPPSQPVAGSLGQFESDVQTQLAINGGDTSGVLMPSMQRMDPDTAIAIYNSGDYADYFDGMYNNFNFTATLFQYQWQQNWLADGYGPNGYTGPTTGTTTWTGAFVGNPNPTPVCNWTN